jgi:hypothetical protein
MVIPLKEVIAIHDLKFANSKVNNEFIKNMKTGKKVVDISGNDPKSFVITTNMIYLSAISSLTLKKRASDIIECEND